MTRFTSRQYAAIALKKRGVYSYSQPKKRKGKRAYASEWEKISEREYGQVIPEPPKPTHAGLSLTRAALKPRPSHLSVGKQEFLDRDMMLTREAERRGVKVADTSTRGRLKRSLGFAGKKVGKAAVSPFVRFEDRPGQRPKIKQGFVPYAIRTPGKDIRRDVKYRARGFFVGERRISPGDEDEEIADDIRQELEAEEKSEKEFKQYSDALIDRAKRDTETEKLLIRKNPEKYKPRKHYIYFVKKGKNKGDKKGPYSNNLSATNTMIDKLRKREWSTAEVKWE